MITQEQTKNNEDYIALLQKLPRLSCQYRIEEDGDYIPTLYRDGSLWYISWIKISNGDMLDEYWANTIEDVVRIAFDKCQAKITSKQKSK